MSRLFVGLTVELVPWAESDLSGEGADMGGGG